MSNSMLKISLKEVIHHTDLTFQRFCEKAYGINRGVYNTIDKWFYDKKLTNILERRKKILYFLSFLSIQQNRDKLKIGRGGLASKLVEFWQKETSNTG